MNNEVAILYTTVSSEKDAEHLAHLALSSKVAACANIIPNGKSVYLWNGKIEQSAEFYILFKTTIAMLSTLEQLITGNHPYDTPAILKFNPESSESFFSYITRSIESPSTE